MIRALKAIVVRHLREAGFTGTFPHFRRLGPDRTDLLTVFFDKSGGGFAVEIARAPAGPVVTTDYGETVDARKLTAWHMIRRLRLGARDEGGHHWFRYDRWRPFRRGDVYEETARRVLPFLERQAERWWAAT